MLLRPDDEGPQISVRQPSGIPPVSASTEAMPLRIRSGEGRWIGEKARGMRCSSACSSRVRSSVAAVIIEWIFVFYSPIKGFCALEI
jgi:predicted PP-loop superfamily ATPase